MLPKLGQILEKAVSYKETLVKTVICRVLATCITILSGKIISGSWTFGLAVGGLDTVLKTITYFGYELSWEKYWTKFRAYTFKKSK